MLFVEAGDLNTAIGRSYNARYQGESIDQRVRAQRARRSHFYGKLHLAACALCQRALRIGLDHRGLLYDYSLGECYLNTRSILQGDTGSNRDVAHKARSQTKTCGRSAIAKGGKTTNIRDGL